MAEPSAKRPPKIRIKLGGQTIQAAKGLSVKRRLQQLGYPAPDVSGLARVEDVLEMPPFLDGLSQSPVAWEDFVAELGVTVSNCSGSQHRPGPLEGQAPVEPPCKRARCSQRTPNHEPMVVDSALPTAAATLHAQTGPIGSGHTRPSDPPVPPAKPRQPDTVQPAPAAQEVPSKHSPSVVLVQASKKEEHGACLVSTTGGPPQPPLKALPHICTKEESGTGVPSSSSDQATTFAMSQSTSPTEVTAAPAMQQRNRSDGALAGSRPQQEQAPCPLPPPAPRSHAKEKTQPAYRANQHCMSVQTDVATCVLPAPLLETATAPPLPDARPTQLSQMQLPPHKCYMPVPSDLATASTEEQARGLMSAAVERKRQADKLRGHNCWTTGTIVLYIESALLFMRAVEGLLRLPSGTERGGRALQLCTQTADFLLFTCKSVDALSASSVVRDCLRSLCERLLVICLMREACLPAAKFKELADKLDRLLDSARGGGGAGDIGLSRLMHSSSGAGGRQGTGAGRPSPDDASHASSDKLAGPGKGSGHVHTSQELGQLKAQITHGAQQMTRFADMVRKTVMNFQALVEREDVRQNEAAMEACMHISALSMCGGFIDGGRAIAHAYQVLKCVQAL